MVYASAREMRAAADSFVDNDGVIARFSRQLAVFSYLYRQERSAEIEHTASAVVLLTRQLVFK